MWVATISKSCARKCFIIILVECNEESPANQEFLESTTAGLDVGIGEFVILSIEEKIENPEYLKLSI